MAGSGGAWKVAYADFVTAMMAFFLVMWIVAQNKPVKQAVAHYFSDPSGSGTKPGGSSMMRHNGGKDARGGQGPIRGAKGTGSLETEIKLPGGLDRRPSPGRRPVMATHRDGKESAVGVLLLFGETAAELDKRSREKIDEVVPLMLGKPNKVEVRGHSSRKPLPKGTPFADGWQLSYARCTATMKYLEQHGIEPERLRLSQAGASEPPMVRTTDAELAAQDACVEIYMLDELVAALVEGPSQNASASAAPVDEPDARPQPARKPKPALKPKSSAAPPTKKTIPRGTNKASTKAKSSSAHGATTTSGASKRGTSKGKTSVHPTGTGKSTAKPKSFAKAAPRGKAPASSAKPDHE